MLERDISSCLAHPREGTGAMKTELEERPISIESLVNAVRSADPDGRWAVRAQTRLDSLTKPPGSMGRLERLALRLAIAQGRERPSAERKRVVVFAADHGVCDEGVSAYPRQVTAQLCHAYCAGGGVVNALAAQVGAEVTVVDVGVDADLSALSGIRHAKVAAGTRNILREDAMTRTEVLRAMAAGAEVVRSFGAVDLLAVGEVGIGNTTAAAALAGVLTGRPAREVVGRGTGVDDEGLARKVAVVEAVGNRSGGAAPLACLGAAGGFEFAALTGAILAAAAQRSVVLLDGYATGVAALLAARLTPRVLDYLVASHQSAEPGHQLVLAELRLDPLLHWDLRLGEASGAVLAIPLLEAACCLLRDVSTFEEARVLKKSEG